MKGFAFVLLSMMLIPYSSCEGKGVINYKGNYDILLSSGEYYFYNDGEVNLKLHIQNDINRLLPDVASVCFFDFYNNGILVVATEYINNETALDKLAIYFLDNDNKPERIMEFNGIAYSQFFLYKDVLFCYFKSELIVIDIKKQRLLCKKELEINNITIKNIFIDIETNICVLSSNDYYINDTKKNILVMNINDSNVQKSFQGVLLEVDIGNKKIYYFDYKNGLLSYNYNLDMITELEILNIPENFLDPSMGLNRLYIIDHYNYIFCYARKKPVSIARTIFPHSDSSLYEYIYFISILSENKFIISGQISFNNFILEHGQIKRIRMTKSLEYKK